MTVLIFSISFVVLTITISFVYKKIINNLYSKIGYLESENKEINENNIKLNERVLNLIEELNKRKNYYDVLSENSTFKNMIENLKVELKKRENYYEIKSENAKYEERIKQQQEYFEKIKKEMETNFKNLSNEIIKQQKNDFTEEQNILFKPFKEQVIELKNKIEENNKINNENKTRFEEQMKFFGNKSDNLTKQAQDLTEALKGNKKVRGNWGEFKLDNLLQLSGMEEGVDYERQKGVEDRVIPDVVINMPGEKHLVVDSKVALDNYKYYITTNDEEYLNKYVEDIKKHIDKLSSKEYNKKLGEKISFDFVVMFLPLEGAYVDAIKTDNSIYEYAYKKGVSISTPSSLMPILMTIGSMCGMEKQNKNIKEIVKKAKLLCDRIMLFKDAMNGIENGLKSANDSFILAKERLLINNTNVIKTAEDIVRLGGIKVTEKTGRKSKKKNDDIVEIEADFVKKIDNIDDVEEEENLS